MKKFLNLPEAFESEMLEGIVRAHQPALRPIRADRRGLVWGGAPVQGKVALATGGGSGHLPLFLGYVGRGMLDGVAVGDVFASPNSRVMLEVTRAIHGGAGVLYIYGNYGGDVLNFELAAEMARDEGITVETVVATDDVASAPKGDEAMRRGVAGLFYLYKVAGALAEKGGTLQEVKRVAKAANAQVRTMGAALTPCYLPATGRPSFSIAEDEMEFGMGIHGEPGMDRLPVQPARVVVERMLEAILDDLEIGAGASVSVLVNGLGATPLEELYILFGEAARWLEGRGISVVQPYIGEFATSLEMSGASLSVLVLTPELQELLSAPCATPFWRQV